jgi:hypothetical protein
LDPSLLCAPWYSVKKSIIASRSGSLLTGDVIPEILARAGRSAAIAAQTPAAGAAQTPAASAAQAPAAGGWRAAPPARWVSFFSTFLVTLELSFFARHAPRYARLLLLICFVLALGGMVRVAVKHGTGAGRAIWSLSFLRSAWPIPTAELKALLPPGGRISFATDIPDDQAVYMHAHVQNRLAPLIVLHDRGDPQRLAGAEYVVMNFVNSRREQAYCAARDIIVAARLPRGFAVGVRRR